MGLTPKRIKEVRGLAWEQPEGAARGVETGLGCLQEPSAVCFFVHRTVIH